jgi:hypothetical protein
MLQKLSLILIIIMLIMSCGEPCITEDIIYPIITDTTEYFIVSSEWYGEQTLMYRISFEIINVNKSIHATTAHVKEYSDDNINYYWLLYGRQEAQCDSLELDYQWRVDLWYDSIHFDIDSIDVSIQLDSLIIEKRIYDINII